MTSLDSSIIALLVFAGIGLVAVALVVVAVARDGYGPVPDRDGGRRATQRRSV